jgi:hypothetical protein
MGCSRLAVDFGGSLQNMYRYLFLRQEQREEKSCRTSPNDDNLSNVNSGIMYEIVYQLFGKLPSFLLPSLDCRISDLFNSIMSILVAELDLNDVYRIPAWQMEIA